MRSLAVVALGLALSLVTAGPGMAQFLYVQGKPMEVTTDTVAYCDQLSAQVATARRMCRGWRPRGAVCATMG
jgi:hypothetical protein